ncbi:HPr-rel-A system PqqD family peptide chaperone [Metabacillus malikii]|uniref:PqqD family protein of HPr-rel-A system n=1 Tax=Metabacillus malikii TaxID=1504265 RepID=A0ABT9ZKR3_9BACI|nr:HPr-rel-A system PqqD family peptide chaperone [Metabacillus malikii]MDQ0232887.1 PqqD family protein of HPr-rel-A system [Metabacillus malikii]
MKAKRELKIIEQDDGAVIFEKRSGIYFQVNHVGRLLIERIAEGKTKSELVAELEKTFGLEKANAEEDVNDFFSMLREVGLT